MRTECDSVQYYSPSGSGFTEFGASAVESDAALYWYTDQTDPEPANWTETYYFDAKTSDLSKVDICGDGGLSYDAGGVKGEFQGGVFSVGGLVKSGQTLKIYPADDGVRNITWSDDAADETQKVDHGKVVIESAVIGTEDAMSLDPQYSQSGNKGYVGVKGGATVTVKLIPDYGYQVESLELNGQRLTPQDEVATYTFTMPDTNLHLSAIFTPSGDEASISTDGVSDAYIVNGENATKSGNLCLTVANTGMSAAEQQAMKGSQAAAGAALAKTGDSSAAVVGGAATAAALAVLAAAGAFAMRRRTKE